MDIRRPAALPLMSLSFCQAAAGQALDVVATIQHGQTGSDKRPPRRAVVSRNDRLAIICSVLLLLTILAAGGYLLSSYYYYNEPGPEDEPRD
jgi:hypothetical protein